MSDEIRLKSLLDLLTTVASFRQPRIEVVRYRFSQNSTSFNAITEFLKRINLLLLKHDRFELNAEAKRIIDGKTDSERRERLSDFINLNLLAPRSFYRNQVRDFLVLFSMTNGELVSTTSSLNLRHMAGIRNIFLETGFIRRIGSELHISSEYRDQAVSSQNRHSSLKILKNSLRNQELLGAIAEDFVVEFEKRRLFEYPDLISTIERISERVPSAGYDVISYHVVAGLIRRLYIEVKAVSLQDFKFYWTRNEKLAAHRLGDDYHLYLVPFSVGKRPKEESILIVKDPLTALSQPEWNRKIELVSYFLN